MLTSQIEQTVADLELNALAIQTNIARTDLAEDLRVELMDTQEKGTEGCYCSCSGLSDYEAARLLDNCMARCQETKRELQLRSQENWVKAQERYNDQMAAKYKLVMELQQEGLQLMFE